MLKSSGFFRLTIAAAVLASGTPSYAQRDAEPVSADAVLHAADSCLTAMRDGSLDSAALDSAGWDLATEVSVDGEDRANELLFRSHDDYDLLMITPPDNDTCIILGPIESENVVTRVRQQLLDDFPGSPVTIEALGDVWVSSGRSFALARSDEGETLALRLIIGIQGT